MTPVYFRQTYCSRGAKRGLTPALLILLAAGMVFSAASMAQAQTPIEQPPSKVAVAAGATASAPTTAPATPVGQASGTEALPDAGKEEDRPKPPALVVASEDQDTIAQDTAQASVQNEGANAAAGQSESHESFESSLAQIIAPSSVEEELIPGLAAAKMPPMPTGSDPDALPVYVSGEHMEGFLEADVRVLGRGQVIRGMTVVQAEELTYNRQTEVATACMDVRINQEGNIFKGTYAQLHVPTNQGYFENATYLIGATGAQGDASRIDFLSKDDMLVHQASYTLCDIKPDGKYDWILKADTIELDFEKDEGVARNAVMRFMGVPILATPWMSFPLSDKRRSGWLAPTFDMDSDNGFTYEQPYYWNIAPNYDATLTPIFMVKRGIALNTQFRYLQPNFSGEIGGVFLPNDRLRDKDDRWGYTVKHRQWLTESMKVLGRAHFNLELNRASDDNYWEDFPRNSSSLTTRLLNNEGMLTTHGPGFSTLVRVQRWQTLQDNEAYIIPPFDRTQFRFNFDREDQHGFDFSAMGDLTQFEADDQTRSNVNGSRSVLRASVSYPLREPGWFIVPKAQMMSRYYAFKDPVVLKSTLNHPWLANDITTRHKQVSVPTFSLDTGLIFERQTSLFGGDYVQTLEPRVMYTYTPYRDQSMLPLYDTGLYDYNLATIYLDNPYSGYDRIADVNMMTVGVGSTWQNPQTGAKALSLNIAQRLRFEDQRVTLDNEPITHRYSDVLVSVGTGLVQNWWFDAMVQYDTNASRTQRSLLMARWKPGRYRVLNMGYRRTVENNEQLDFSWQWPLGSPWMGPELPGVSKSGGRWYSVGRINYSLRDSKLVDGILGLEYQSCCWVARATVERISTGRTKVNTRASFQLEFSGLSRVGMNPLSTLRDNISHYELIRNERAARPNDFYLYE